ncbi:MAG: replicative DNA helicase [Thermoguttaceae bacterium]|jgi:replicative DNA helicase|nr:replicative DNA helicase [Thermoguttaceae bacterium]
MVGARVDGAHAAERVPSEILDRLPPHNLEAERGVLGSILLDPSLCDDVVLVLRPEDFYADPHRRLFSHMVAMHDEGKRIDATLIVERLKQKGDFEAVGGAAYLAEIIHSVPVAAHALYYANIVRDKAMLRDLIHASTAILRDAYDPTLDPQELVSRSEERIFAVHDQRSSDQVASINDVLLKAFDEIDRRMQGGAAGVPTGFTDLDELTGGLHPSELIILAARPSMGKTALALNIAENVAVKANVPTLFVSLEMSRQELAQRMLCSRGKINGRKFRSSFLSAEDRTKLVEASSILSKAPLYIDDSPSRTVTEIAACARRLKRKANLGFVAIDYLQLIEPDNPKDPRQEQVAKIARRLKGMARELNLPVLCLAQLNRQAEVARENRPKLSHLRESGAIEQDADVVMFIHREEYGLSPEEAQEQNVAGKAELIVAKQRNGPTDDVPLVWRKEYTTFENAATKPYDEFAPFDGGF